MSSSAPPSYSPEFIRLTQEVVREATEGIPSDPLHPDLGTERRLTVSQSHRFPKIFVCFNGERPIPHSLGKELGERIVHILGHVNVLQDFNYEGYAGEPDRFYWLTQEGEVVLRESPNRIITEYSLLDTAKISALTEKLSAC